MNLIRYNPLNLKRNVPEHSAPVHCIVSCPFWVNDFHEYLSTICILHIIIIIVVLTLSLAICRQCENYILKVQLIN